MPRPDINYHHDGVLRRMENGPIAQRLIFGWGIEWCSMRYLVNVGYVRLFYDWEDQRTKAELTAAGRSHVERERESNRAYLSAAVDA